MKKTMKMIRGKRLLAFSIATMLAFCAHATWTVANSVLSSDVSGWQFYVDPNFSYNDGVETFTGLKVSGIKKTGNGVIDFRDEPFADGLKLIGFGTSNGTAIKLNGNSIKLPDTLVYLAGGVFAGVTFADITPLLPESIRYIGGTAFKNASIGGKLVLGGGGHPLDFGGDQHFSGTGIKEAEFGNGATYVGTDCFLKCSSLTNVTFKGNVDTIGPSAFSGCTGLNNVTFCGDLLRIESSAFNGCNALASFVPELPKSLTYLATKAFYNCNSLKEIRLGGDAAFTFGDGGSYFYRVPITVATIGAGVASLPSSLFEDSDGSFKTLICEGFPENVLAVCQKTPQWERDRRYIVPADNADWDAFLAEHSYVPWDLVSADKKNHYPERFGSAAETPSGIAKFQGNKEAYVIKRSSSQAEVYRLRVTTSPDGIGGSALTPPAGDYDNISELPMNCSVADGAAHNAAGTIAYECTGYETSSQDGETWVPTGSGTGRTFVYNPQQAGFDQLTWIWEPVAYKMTVNCPAGFGSVSISGDEYETGFYSAGTDVALTATAADPSAAPFVRWYGDVDEAQAANPTITVKADKARTLIPYFANSWTYDGAKQKITDGYWTFNVSASGTSLTLSKASGQPVVCDLTKPILDGETKFDAVAFADQCFYYSSLEELHLPKTITAIPTKCFQGSQLKELHLEAVPTSIADNAFMAISRTVTWYVQRTAAWQMYVADGTKCKTWESMSAAEKGKWTVPGVEPAAQLINFTYCWLVYVEVAAESHTLVIDVSPSGLVGASLDPEADTHSLEADQFPVACSVEDGAAYDATGTTAYECTGYETMHWDEDAGQWETTGNGTGRNFDYDPQGEGMDRLTWIWEPVAYKFTVNCPAGFGSVAISGDEYAIGFYGKDTDVTLTATAADADGAPFVRWYGDVDAAQAANPTITVKADKARTLIPYFRHSWTYDGAKQKITDGYWTFNVSASGTSLTLSKASGQSVVCDLTKPILDGETKFDAVAFADQCFRLNGNVTVLRLPATLTSFGNQCFERSSITDVYMKTIPSMGNNAFGSIARNIAWFVPRTSEWEAYVADGTLCKTWKKDLTPAEKAKWTRTDVMPAAQTRTYSYCWLVFNEQPLILFLR